MTSMVAKMVSARTGARMFHSTARGATSDVHGNGVADTIEVLDGDGVVENDIVV